MSNKKFEFNVPMLKKIREHLNFSLEEASQGITKTSQCSPVEVLKSWENGTKTPTLIKLNRLFEKTYRYPIYVIFKNEIPEEEKYFDYRFGSDNKISGPEERLLREFEIEMVLKQEILREIAEGNDWDDLEFVGCLKDFKKVTPKDVVKKMYELLGITSNDLVSRFKQNKKDQKLIILRDDLEEIGVFTFLFANLPKSTHKNTKLSPKSHFRGMARSDSKVPLIVINKDISPAGKLFTIIHEFCHLLLGDKTITAFNAFGDEDAISRYKEENFCNDVASEFFISETDFVKNWNNLENQKLNFNEKCEEIAEKFGMSPVMGVTKAYKKGFCEKEEYREYCNNFYKDLEAFKKATLSKKGGPPPHRVIQKNLGKMFIKTIKEGYSDDLIAWSDALHALGCDIDKFPTNGF